MWKRHKKCLIIVLGCLAAAHGAHADGPGVSAPTEGIARHLETGSAEAPIVRWVDNPKATDSVERLIGNIEIALPGGTGGGEAANRVMLLSSSCSGDRDVNMNFVYEGGLLETMGEGGSENHGVITGVPKMPDGWTNGLGVSGGPKNEEILETANLNGANVWSKAGHTAGEKVIVKVEQTGGQATLPGYYTATYCVQQIVN